MHPNNILLVYGADFIEHSGILQKLFKLPALLADIGITQIGKDDTCRYCPCGPYTSDPDAKRAWYINAKKMVTIFQELTGFEGTLREFCQQSKGRFAHHDHPIHGEYATIGSCGTMEDVVASMVAWWLQEPFKDYMVKLFSDEKESDKDKK